MGSLKFLMTVKTDKLQMNGVLANKIFTQKDFL